MSRAPCASAAAIRRLQICFASRELRQKSCIWASESVLDSPSVHSSSRAHSGNGSVREKLRLSRQELKDILICCIGYGLIGPLLFASYNLSLIHI